MQMFVLHLLDGTPKAVPAIGCWLGPRTQQSPTQRHGTGFRIVLLPQNRYQLT